MATIADLISDRHRFDQLLADYGAAGRAIQEAAGGAGAVDRAIRAAQQNQRMLRKILLEEARRPRNDPFWILLNPRSPSRRKRKAARAIAATMPTKIANRKAYYALKEEQGQLWLREKVFVPALLEAARSKQRPQYVRFGARWVTDESGRKALVRPFDRSEAFVKRWLMTRAWAIAAKKLELGRHLPPLTEKQLDAIRWSMKKQGVTPETFRKRLARTHAKLAQFQKRWQRGAPS